MINRENGWINPFMDIICTGRQDDLEEAIDQFIDQGFSRREAISLVLQILEMQIEENIENKRGRRKSPLFLLTKNRQRKSLTDVPGFFISKKDQDYSSQSFFIYKNNLFL